MNRLRFVLALLAFPLAIACSDNGTDPIKAETFVGAYTLKTINGHALPAALVMEDESLNITSAFAELMDDLTWSVTINGIDAEDIPFEQPSSGTLVIDGQKIRLIDPNPEAFAKLTATLNGKILTVKFEGKNIVFVFERMEAA